MKYLLFFATIMLVTTATTAQTHARKELRKEKQAKQIEKINHLISSNTFKFEPSQAMPLSGGTVQLTGYFSAQIKGDSIFSYLPYYGVAYYVEYGKRNSPFHFDKLIENYSTKKDRDGYRINFDVKKMHDKLNFTFDISELGYASLIITSTNRQSISYYGRIEETEEKQ